MSFVVLIVALTHSTESMLRSWRRELYFFSSVVTKLKLSVELFHVLGIPVCQLLITLNALFEFSIRLEN